MIIVSFPFFVQWIWKKSTQQIFIYIIYLEMDDDWNQTYKGINGGMVN